MNLDKSKENVAAHLMRFERNFLSSLLETTNALIVVLDMEGRIFRLNRAIEQLTEFTIIEAVGRLFWELFLPANEWSVFSARFADSSSLRFRFEAQSRIHAKSGVEYHVLWSSNTVRREDETVEFILVTGIDITALKQAEHEKENLILDLQAAMAKVKTLNGLLPICASCRKIRDDRGYWQQVEDYIRMHSDADFTHSICPDCAIRLYPEFADIWSHEKNNDS
jgi:PAS domain S-box-containing protein